MGCNHLPDSFNCDGYRLSVRDIYRDIYNTCHAFNNTCFNNTISNYSLALTLNKHTCRYGFADDPLRKYGARIFH